MRRAPLLTTEPVDATLAGLGAGELPAIAGDIDNFCLTWS